MPSFGPSSARAEASRRNGAQSRGPKTPEGKTRSARNALKHGLRAQKYVVLPAEDAAAFETLEAALMEELAPEGALQVVLARRIVAATWRLERAERLEIELFAENHLEGASLGLALIRDCNRARAFETLVRYRGGTLAEFWRALRTLKALQAEKAAPQAEAAPRAEARPGLPAPAPRPAIVAPAPHGNPIEPERRGNPGKSPMPPANEPARHPSVAHAARGSLPVAAVACMLAAPSPAKQTQGATERRGSLASTRPGTADLLRGPGALPSTTLTPGGPAGTRG